MLDFYKNNVKITDGCMQNVQTFSRVTHLFF